MRNIFLYIKRGFIGLVLTGSSTGLYAQIIPNGSVPPSATPANVPGPVTRTVINYVRTWDPSMPISDPAAVRSSTDVNAVKQSTQYFDGLGRPLETVSKGISTGGKDLVFPVIYDSLGREQFKYLPYVQQSGNINDGKFKADPFNAQKAFYQNTTLNPGAAGENVYYNRVDYEASPLNRVLKTYGSGNSWAKNDGSTVERGGNKPVQNQYRFNVVGDSVRIWTLSASGLPVSPGTYGLGTLYTNLIRDEDGKYVIEYRDKEDKVILKKIQSVSGTAHVGWLCTYYVYDDLNNLRFVIPPKAVALIRVDWNLTTAVTNGLCFSYRYDGHNRMIVKKVPGAEPTEMVYDVRDRLVFVRDGNLKGKNQWLTTFYDGLDRPVMTALYTSGATRDALQASLNAATSNTQIITHNIPEILDLVVGSYDGRNAYTARNSITFEDGFDAGTGAEFTAETSPGANQETISVTVTNPLPDIPTSALTPLTYTFYDNYSYSGAHAAYTGDFNKPQAGSNPYAEPLTGTSNRTQGLITGTKVKTLNANNQWLTTTTYYNDKGRVIQTLSDNVGDGKDIVTNLYDFSGKLLSSYQRHNNSRSGVTPQTTVLTLLAYDHAGRLISIKKRLNDNTSLERTLAANEYDELGQLKTKRLGIAGSGNPLEILNYEYNLRGWLRGINKGFVNTNNSTSNWFGQELNYDYGFIDRLYNGNIIGTKWKSRSDQAPRAYGYTYDNSNRLTAAAFSQQNTTGAAWTRDQKDFSVSGLVYDANGNIVSMNQKGMDGTAIKTIDSLKYAYQSNSNQLLYITDKLNNVQSQLGDFKEVSNNLSRDYWFDKNSNLTRDLNKRIDTILYNHLNLPESITITSKGTIRYLYDAAGNKLRKTVTDNTVTPAKVITTDYMGGFVYQNDTLQLLSHEEGRVRTVFKTGQPMQYVYDYFVKDHLGNVRMVLTEQDDFSMYAATMETDKAATETALFSNVEETRVPKPVGYPQDNTTQQNASVAKLNAKDGGKKIGPSLVLRVMAGDTIQIGARAFYKSQGPKDRKSGTPAEDMVASLVQAFGGSNRQGNTHNTVAPDQLSPFAGNFNSNDYQRLKEKDPNQNKQDKPKAYLNFVLFDDQFNLVDDNSGVRQVKGEPDQLQTLAVDKMTMKKSGFLYVYTSNEMPQDVFFDNVTVLADPGPLLEETHYYPFGLTMAGISSNALKGARYPENRVKFNGYELQNKEFNDGSGLEWYDYKNRFYDQQIGRFFVVDKLASQYPYYSPYQFAGNEVPNAIDLDGLEPYRGPRYAQSSAYYAEQKRSYRQVNSYVPDTRSYRNTSNYTSNGYNQRATPSDVYEPAETGSGQSVTGPFVTRNNTQGQVAVKSNDLVENVKEFVDKITITTDNSPDGSGGYASSSSVAITFTDKGTERAFKEAQSGYNKQVDQIRGANPLPAPPGPNASPQEKAAWFQKVEETAIKTNLQIGLLGPSPTQQLVNDAQQNKDQYKITTTVQPLPEIRQKYPTKVY